MNAAKVGSALQLAWAALLLAALALLAGCILVKMVNDSVLDADTGSRLMTLSAVVPGAALLGIFAAVVIRRERLAGFMLVSTALMAAATIGWMLLLWRQTGTTPLDDWAVPLKLCVSLTLVGGGLAIFGHQVTAQRGAALVRSMRWGMLVFGGIFVIATLLCMWSVALQRYVHVLLTVAAISLGLAWLGLVGLLLATWVTAGIKRRESMARRIEVNLVCPRCGETQPRPTGLSRCAKCRLALHIELDEPRCECDYLLYRLTADRCPECGRSIPESMRWV